MQRDRPVAVSLPRAQPAAASSRCGWLLPGCLLWCVFVCVCVCVHVCVCVCMCVFLFFNFERCLNYSNMNPTEESTRSRKYVFRAPCNSRHLCVADLHCKPLD